MKTTWILAACLGGLLFSAPAAAQRARGTAKFHDPLAAVEPDLDPAGREILAAFPAYDAERITKAIRALVARQGTDAEQPLDGYLLGQGYAELLVIHRFYERKDPEAMPACLQQDDPDAFSERGLRAARAFAAANPEHADVHRLEGELISFQIRGMGAGMTKGPKARKAIERARELDPRNCWAEFARARMHFHNPAFVGGDKTKALREFRAISKSVDHFRVSLYLAETYRAKDMLPQAEFWIAKAAAQAPENPEIRYLARVMAEEKGAGQ